MPVVQQRSPLFFILTSLAVHSSAITAALLAASIGRDSRIYLDVDYNEVTEKDHFIKTSKNVINPSGKLKISIKKNSLEVGNQNPASAQSAISAIKSNASLSADDTETAASKTETVPFSNYLQSIIRLISQKKSYPVIAQRRGQQGQVTLRLKLNRAGQVLSVEIINPSPYQELNEAALLTVKQISKYPEIPAELKDSTLVLKIPINYRIQN